MNALGLAVAAGAAVVAGAINSAAGGGSFISFPTLIFLGVPPITANATNTTAMWIGQGGSIRGFGDDLTHPKPGLVAGMVVSAAGGIAGALLLLHTPPHAFNAVIPWLLLLATLLFAAGPAILKLTNRPGGAEDIHYSGLLPLFAIAVYGGFFGGGQGLMILAALALLGMTDLRRMNAHKSVLAFINNGVPVIPFVIARAITWDVAVVMCVGATLGGYYGARVTRRIPPRALRIGIVAAGAVTTVLFFFRAGG